MTFDLEKEIKNRLNRKWTFGEIQNMKETCVGIANAIYFEMPLTEKYQLIMNRVVGDYTDYSDGTISDLFKGIVTEAIFSMVLGHATESLKTATVTLGEEE
tara:strand:- start:1288 stop:1590 length:303 start_codon:yes stop_codon:yes gene_type:complete